MWKALVYDEDGLTTVEYALLVAMVVVAAIATWTSFGSITRAKVMAASNGIQAFPTG